MTSVTPTPTTISATASDRCGPGLVRLDGTLIDDGRRTPQATLVLDGDTIVYAGACRDLPAHWQTAALPPGWSPDLLLLPGLVDIHHHGGAGGEYGPDVDASRRAALHHRQHGSTTLVGSLVSNYPATLDAGVATCAGLVAEGLLDGIHLEGPFLSDIRCGAQNPAALTDVDVHLVERLVTTAAAAGAADALVQMTFAPERPGADQLPAVLAEHGIIGAVGHTDATEAQTRAAIDHVVHGGARQGRAIATHVFNAMRPLRHRDPGPIAGCLAAAARGDLILEVIGDGAHLDAGTVRMLFDLVGPHRIALITDALSACGMPPGRYTLGDLDIIVDDTVCRLADGGSIAGSIATLVDVLRWTVCTAGVPLTDAVTAASATPADVAGFGGAGRLRVGSRADILALTSDSAEAPLHVRAVYQAGCLMGSDQTSV